MLFGLWAQTGPRNHESDGGPDPHEKGQLWGSGLPIKVQELSAVSCAETTEPIDLPFGYADSGGPKEA